MLTCKTHWFVFIVYFIWFKRRHSFIRQIFLVFEALRNWSFLALEWKISFSSYQQNLFCDVTRSGRLSLSPSLHKFTLIHKYCCISPDQHHQDRNGLDDGQNHRFWSFGSYKTCQQICCWMIHIHTQTHTLAHKHTALPQGAYTKFWGIFLVEMKLHFSLTWTFIDHGKKLLVHKCWPSPTLL